MKLDLIQTVALAGVVLFLGYGIRRLIQSFIALAVVSLIVESLRAHGKQLSGS